MAIKKTSMHEGTILHYSAGAWVQYGNGIVLVDRLNIPYGYAGPSGHIDEGEDALTTIFREVQEETGLFLKGSLNTLFENVIVKGNVCKSGAHQHAWSLYAFTAGGELSLETSGAKSVGIYSKQQIAHFINHDLMEPIWKRWIQEYDLLNKF